MDNLNNLVLQKNHLLHQIIHGGFLNHFGMKFESVLKQCWVTTANPLENVILCVSVPPSSFFSLTAKAAFFVMKKKTLQLRELSEYNCVNSENIKHVVCVLEPRKKIISAINYPSLEAGWETGLCECVDSDLPLCHLLSSPCSKKQNSESKNGFYLCFIALSSARRSGLQE